ncbi:transporter substrate-binding domain-containing protein [Spartinivicinus poritis]|uniref:Transporter substrate-binding domain-containing protein n=1 Tax=Spartinivicinus poritis TaxID=2994640 RepID=A0ABT5U4B6_9GAMM|nr:transporter substrate-binding domain-containing protein [Spartinivicinus sp. A2-2]MDE1461214.1 transporter substrate-binding domain-containing protein [Spartinivicinus sp. A2-2]
MLKRLLAAIFLTLFSYTSIAGEEIPIWSYYESPPFGVNEDKSDITSFLATYLTSHSGGKWSFISKFLPRPRLNKYLEEQQKGIAIWANPIWFGDKSETRYDWTNSVVLGRNEIVSLKESPVPYQEPSSLTGKKFGGVRGHRYVGIDDLVSNGKINRKDSASFEKNFLKLLSKRVDVILIPRGELFHLMKKNNAEDKIYIASQPHQVYKRKMLVTKNLPGVRDFINNQLNTLKNNNDWITLLKNAGIYKESQ